MPLSDDDIRRYNSEVSGYFQATSTPNPQLAADAMQSNTLSNVTHAALTDPNAKDITELLPQTGAASDTNPAAFSWTDYQQKQQKLWKDDANLAKSYADIKGQPAAHFDYYKGVAYQVNQDPAAARAWQARLDQAGLYGDHHPDHTGHWTPADAEALNKYLVAYATPLTLAKDPTQRSQARALLDFLYKEQDPNASFDGDKFALQVKDDPKVANSVFGMYMMTGGHSLEPEQIRSMLKYYRTNVGDVGLSDVTKKLAEGQAVDSPWFTHLPGWGVVTTLAGADFTDHPSDDEKQAFFQKHPDLAKSEGWDLQAKQYDRLAKASKTAGMTRQDMALMDFQLGASATDKAALAPLIQKSVDHSDVLASVIGYVKDRTFQSTVTLGMMMGDTAHLQFHPGEDWGHVGHEINQGTPAAALVGEQWYRDHPSAGRVLDVAVDAAFDPTNFVGLAFRFGRFGSMISDIDKAVGTGSALGADTKMAHAVSAGMLDRFAYTFRPAAVMTSLRREVLPKAILNPENDMHDVALLLHVRGGKGEEILKSLYDETGKLKYQPGAEAQLADLIEHEFPHVWSMGSHKYNLQQHLRALSPAVRDRLAGHQVEAMATYGAFDVGWEAHNFAADPYAYLNKIKSEAAALGIDAAKTRSFVNAFLGGATEKRADLASAFIKDVMEPALPGGREGFNAFLAEQNASRAGKYAHLPGFKRFTEHYFAVEPDTAKPATERSMAPRRDVSDSNRAIIAHLDQDKQLKESKLKETVADYWKQETGETLTAANMNRALDTFAAHSPHNELLVKEFEDDFARITQAQHGLAPLGTDRAAPMTENQLQHLFVHPWNTYDLVRYLHPTLRKATDWTGKLGMEGFTNTWKVLEVAKPSTMLRAALGDDILRWSIQLAFMGSPKAAVDAALHERILRSAIAPVVFPATVLRHVGAGVVSGGRGIASHTRQSLADRRYEQAVKDAVGETAPAKGVPGWLKQMQTEWGTEALGLELDKVLGKMHPTASHLMEHNDAGYYEGFKHWVEKQFGGAMSQGWAKVYGENGAAVARDFLHSYLAGKAPGQEMLKAQGLNQVKTHAVKNMTLHREAALKGQRDVEAALAAQPKYVRGSKLGQPKPLSGKQYRDIYSGLPKRTKLIGDPNDPAGKFVTAGLKGDYKGRVEGLVAWHEQMATSVDRNVQAVADRIHDFHADWMSHPTIRGWVAKGKVSPEDYQKFYSNEANRTHLPRINIMQNTVDGRNAASRFMEAPSRSFMEHVFKPFIGGARANGAEALRKWYIEFLTHATKGKRGWDEERIKEVAMHEAQAWILDNTYRGSRTVADVAMRNVFPFFGATRSMDAFWINQLKTRPVLAGKLIEGEDWLGHHKDSTGFDLPNPLSAFGWGGGKFHVDPGSAVFALQGGMGSFVPGVGPIWNLFGGLAAQNSQIKAALALTPWSDHIPGSLGQALTGVAPGFLRKPMIGGMELAGAPASFVGGADYDRAAREAQAEGRQLSADDARHKVGVQNIVSGVVSGLLPIAPAFTDPRSTKIFEARKELDAGGKVHDVAQKYKDVAPLLLYIDKGTTVQEKDALAKQYPWIIPYATSMYQTAGGLAKPSGTDEFHAMLNNGDEQVMGVDAYNNQVNLARQNGVAWQAYNNTYKAKRDDWMAQHPDSGTSTQEYRDFKAATLDPIISDLQHTYPDWYAKFFQNKPYGTSVQQVNSAPISTMNVLMHMPMDSSFSTEETKAWGHIMTMVDTVSSYITGLRSEGINNPAATQRALDQFHNQLLAYTDQYPQLQEELITRYHWSSWEDFVRVQADAQYKQQRADQANSSGNVLTGH